tara:strand:+ start:377 stop:550 length:174 start_codon:yes stop_codon:yes gene_type:complete
MKNLDKKSNTNLMELKLNLAKDYELVRHELKHKLEHWESIKRVYESVLTELKNRNLE